ncbi:MAG: SPFH domain-containing protein [Planctomycetes bacterium]|nr:SPFH domain-containing protein [Planctomycetota bacterium]MCB9918450.1 SPFH domain-containing protein [Planctomycetota bacterium]
MAEAGRSNLPSVNSPSHERVLVPRIGGIGPLLGLLGILGFAILSFALAANQRDFEVLGVVLGIAAILAFVLGLIGLTLVNPNHVKVVLLFGRYVGTVREAGFYWLNPFTVRKTLSVRVRNFNSETLKVNDQRGNPIEIAAIVVWKVRDSAQASFDVEDFIDYVRVQSEAAVRHLASTHPYDHADDGQVSLRGSSQVVNDELARELSDRLELAGIDVLEARLSHLAYAPEIAGAMLQRQQADAIIDARTRIVDGAVGMVKMALDGLRDEQVVVLDEERKAQMISNLLVVLCSDRATQPVVNAGSIY